MSMWREDLELQGRGSLDVPEVDGPGMGAEDDEVEVEVASALLNFVLVAVAAVAVAVPLVVLSPCPPGACITEIKDQATD